MAKLVIGTNKTVAVPAIVRNIGPRYYLERDLDANGKLTVSNKIMDFTGVKDLGNNCMHQAFSGSTLAVNIDLSDITTLSGSQCFSLCFLNCPYLVSVILSSLKTISGGNACQNMFGNCGELTSVDISALETISGASGAYGMFSGCVKLQSLVFDSLKTVTGSNALANVVSSCNKLKTLGFPALNVISQPLAGGSYNAVASGCLELESVIFGGVTASTFLSKTNQLQYLFNAATGKNATNGCTVHFPSNFDPSDPNHTFDASTLTGYPTFGGDASYIRVAFDLPATE